MSENALTTKSFLKYTFMPGLLPRMHGLFGSGFAYFAFLMAQIFNIPQLLPNGHPYLNAANIGRYGIHHVVAEAIKHLEFKRDKSDQVIMFFVMMGGLALIFLQLIALAIAIISPEALAGPLSTYFGTNPASDPSQDIAFIMMDRVFGVPGIFNSCVTTATDCYSLTPDLTYDTTNPMEMPQAPWPFHVALHQVFRFYSSGLLVLAMFILLYYVIVVAAETAQTGTPFGKRFNSVWAPIRLVVAIGLLVPLSSGLNSAQYIVLYAAKLGSNMATNAWVTFNVAIADSTAKLLADGEMVGVPNTPQVGEFLTFMTLAKACQTLEDKYYVAADSQQVIDDNGSRPACEDNRGKRPIKRYLVGSPTADVDHALAFGGGNAYSEALDFYNNGDILVRFGQRNECEWPTFRGHVSGFCGDLVLPVSALSEPGARTIQSAYYNLIDTMWNDPDIKAISDHYVNKYVAFLPDAPAEPTREDYNRLTNKYKFGDPDSNFYDGTIDGDLDNIAEIIHQGVIDAQNPANWDIPAQLLQRGWGGAGIWYNRIAEINGAVVGASRALPQVRHLPVVMEDVANINQQSTLGELPINEMFKLDKAFIKGQPRNGDAQAAQVYKDIHDFLSTPAAPDANVQTGNALADAINFLLGTEGLWNIRSEENENVHPLAQLAGVGKSLVESSVLMLGLGTASGVGCAMGSSGLCTGMGAAYGIATLGLTVGFILFYVIPFLPFVYFFFAVGNWVKGIFEAMVGAPLWALAHLRIDGNGLPGESALNGYYLVFEVFIRPILIIFGFLAGILIFGAMASVLNSIWDLVVMNISGADSSTTSTEGIDKLVTMARGAIDKIFYLVLYTIIMYMLALSSFKLIDMIPNSILRWMGSSVSSFGDFSQDAAQSLTQYAAIGGGMIFQQGLGGVQGGFRGANQAKSAADNAKAQQQLQETVQNLARNQGGG